MRKKILFCVFLLMNLLEMRAQNGFYQYLFHEKGAQVTEAIYSTVNFGEIMVAGHILVHSNSYYSYSFFDEYGNEMQPNFSGAPFTNFRTYELKQPLVLDSNNLLLMFPQYYDTIGKTIIVGLDSNLHTSWSIDSVRFRDLVQKENKEITGFTINPTNCAIYLNRITKTGLFLKDTNYTSIVPFQNYLKRYIVSKAPNFEIIISSTSGDNQRIVWNDSLQIIKNETLYCSNLKEVIYFNKHYVTFESDTSSMLVIRDSTFNAIDTIRFNNEYNITYGYSYDTNPKNLAIVLRNNVDANIYGTNNVNEIFVLDTNFQFVRRRYFRYTHSFDDTALPKNCMEMSLKKINFTTDGGYYFIVKQAVGSSYDANYGLLKLDSLLTAPDTVCVLGYCMDLNFCDSVLSEFYTYIIQDTTDYYGDTTQVNSVVYNFQQNEVSVFPNPTSNDVVVRSEKLMINISLLDMSGNIIYQKSNVFSNELMLGIELNKGCYVIKIDCEGGTFHKKLIVS